MNSSSRAPSRITLGLLGLASVFLFPSIVRADRVEPSPDQPTAQPTARPPAPGNAAPTGSAPAEQQGLERLLASWPPQPRLAAQRIIGEYGPPQVVSREALIWREAGPWTRIKVSRQEIQHDFPMPHSDFLEQTVAYEVPVSKVDALIAFDSSIVVDRTAGELSVSSDSEAHNILTLNLANDILAGRKDVAAARRSMAQIGLAALEGNRQSYAERLQFEPAARSVAFTDRPAPGAPLRGYGPGAAQEASPEADSLGLLIAIDANEVKSADVAEKKATTPAVLDVARRMRSDHGRNIADTLSLATQSHVTPVDTAMVEQMRARGASELFSLSQRQGKSFEVGYLDSLIVGHMETLQLLDQVLIPSASTPEIKQHFIDTRGVVSQHLEQAKRARASLEGVSEL